MIAKWANNYVGVPYKENGRDCDGCDCYGLVWLVYKEALGINLPLYDYTYSHETPATEIAEMIQAGAKGADWQQLGKSEPLEPGDVLLFRHIGDGQHIGLYVGESQMLHTDRGHDAVVVDLGSAKWQSRIIGTYRHTGQKKAISCDSGGIVVTVRPNAFKTESHMRRVEPGLTIAEIVEQQDIKDAYRPLLHAILDTREIPRDYWPRVRPKAGHRLEIIAVPTGQLAEQLGLDNTTLRLGLSTVFTMGGGLISGMIGGPMGWAAGAALGIIGMLLVNALIKPPKMPQERIGYSLSAGQNQLAPYEPIPMVLGKMRVYPPLCALPYTEVEGDDQYLHAMYLIGRGPLEISELKLGETDITDYSGVEVEILEGRDDDPDIKLYDGTVIEQTVGSTLSQDLEDVWTRTESDATGYTAEDLGYVSRTSSANPDRLSIDLEFPRGLCENKNDYLNEVSVECDIEYRELPIGHWIAFDPFVADGDSDVFRDAAQELSSITTVYAWLALLEDGFELVLANIAAMAGGDKAAPEEVLARWDYRLGKLSDRLQVLEAYSTGAHLAYVQNLQADVDALQSALAAWATTTAALTTQTAKNQIDWTQDYYDGAIALTESLILWKKRRFSDAPTESQKNQIADTPWWKRWCYVRWYRQSVLDIFNYGVLFPNNKDKFHTFTEKQNGFMRKSASWYVDSDAAITGGSNQYDVRLRRRSQEEQDDDSAASIYDEMQWATYRTHRDKDAVDIDLLRHHNCPVSLVVLRVKASDQLSGMINNFNCIAEAVLPVYDGTPGPPDYDDWDTEITRNPAWAYLAWLCGHVNANPVDVSRVDVDSFLTWATACDAADPPMRFDAYITKQAEVFKVMNQIAAVGKAAFGMKDGKYSIVRDIEQSTYRQMFTPRNSWGFKTSRQLLEKPHAIRSKFQNADADYQDDERYVYNDGYTSANATRFEDMEYVGVTDPDAVYRMARYHMAVAELRPETAELSADIEHLVCTPGDLVKVASDVVYWGLASGRVKSVGGTTITLDERVPMEAAHNYGIRFRLSDGTFAYRTVTTNAGYQTSITISSAVASLAKGDLFTFGEVTGTDEGSRDMIVKEIKAGNNLSATLVLVDHAPAIHDSDTEEIPDYDPGVTIPPVIDITPPTPVIVKVITDERVLTRDAAGTVRSQIVVYVNPPSSYSGTLPTYLEAEYKRSAATAWKKLPLMMSSEREVVVTGVQDKESYDFRVRYNGAGLVSAWATEYDIEVIGKSSKPPNVSRLWLDSGKTLRWEYLNPPLDLKGFELRYGYGLNAAWDTAEHIHEGVITGRTYALPSTLHGTVKVFIKAVDMPGNYSNTAASITMGLGDKQVENLISTSYLRTLGWPGYLQQMQIADDGALETISVWPDMYDGGDSDLFYGTNDSALFYDADTRESSYIYVFQPEDEEIGATLSMASVITGGAYRIEYREANYLWPSPITEDFWPADLADDLWPSSMEDWKPFQGELVLEDSLYEMRIVFRRDSQYQGRIEQFNLTFDAADIVERLEDITIPAGSWRLPITKTYRAIVSVSITLQNSHQYAHTVRIIDKDPDLGPKVQVLNRYGYPTSGVIDAVIVGY